MSDFEAPSGDLPARMSGPGVIVTLFVLAMSACVLGLVIWKTLDARNTALAQSRVNTLNLVHSLVEHASHTIQSTDIALSGVVDMLTYQTPEPARLNRFLGSLVSELPQLREIGVLDASGNWLYSSLPQRPDHNNSDRNYFVYHRDHTDPEVRINAPLKSRLTGRTSLLLSRRLNHPDGSFAGVITASIDSDYFHSFYQSFQLGPDGGISLLRNDGIMLVHWPSQDSGRDLSSSGLFQKQLKQSPVGYYKISSPYDGLTKYFGYEQITRYPLIVAVAVPEERLLAEWHGNLLSDIAVGVVMLCSVILLAALLSTQFRFRMRMENVLREREQRYRLVTDNIANVVILLDSQGHFVFVSPSVETVLGLDPRALIGKSCIDQIHSEDRPAVKLATARLLETGTMQTAIFRTPRNDGSLAWVELNFKQASRAQDRESIEVVGTMRDVTQRKTMQDELTAVNARLSKLATTDSLTGLANRRTLDGFLRREYEFRGQLSVLLLDIDNFKCFNDSMGHQAGDECLQRVAVVIASATADTNALSARYGGEEFAIILPGASESDALMAAEVIRLKIKGLNIANGASMRGILSVSVGIACRSSTTLNEMELLGEADRALYEAKRRGRDRCVAVSSLSSERRASA